VPGDQCSGYVSWPLVSWPFASAADQEPGGYRRVLDGRIDPGKVFDLTLPLDEVAEAYRAMDERRAIKALLQP
jgi:threonine dehydrogenase-like Zn-dependent dehydrogenase